MVITQIGRKKLGGHHACLGDIMQNTTKMGIFCPFSERVLQKLAQIEQISIFPVNFNRCQFTCIKLYNIFKEH